MNGIFAGLVQGLGTGLKESYDRKNAEKERSKDFLSQAAMYRLQNDENLTGEDQKEGFRQIALQRGVKIPEDALSALFPDNQIETDKYQNPTIPDAKIRPMPDAPPGLGGPEQRSGQGPNGQVSPDQPDQMQQGQEESLNKPGSMFPMPQPRNPMQQNPALLGSGNLGQPSSAPVVQNYTSGVGGSYDDLDLKIQQLKSQLDAPPRPHGSMSSLKLSRAQIAEMRGRRLRDEQSQRDLTMGQYQDAVKLQQQHQEEMRQMQMEAPRLQAHMAAVQQAIGQQLTPDDKKKMLGLNPSAQVEGRDLEAKDYVDALHPETPQGAAALGRIKDNELKRTYQLSAILENQTQIAKMIQESKDPMSNPKLLGRMKIQAAKSTSIQWTISDQQKYLDDRMNYWQQQLQLDAPLPPGVDPVVASYVAANKANPQAMQKLSIELAQKDVAAYKSNLQDKIFMYGTEGSSQVVTLHWLRRRAEEASRNGWDPNKIWDYWKQNATILDDNLEVWDASSESLQMPDTRGPLVPGAPERKFVPKK